MATSLVVKRLGALLAVCALAACGGDEDNGSDECPVIVSDADCDESLRPIVFVHGTFGSGDNIAHVAQLFGSNGYCQGRFVTIEYNSLPGLGASVADFEALLNAKIDEVLEATGQTQVDLMGHSQGASRVYTFAEKPENAAKLAHLVYLAGPANSGGQPSDVPTLSLSSEADGATGPDGLAGAEARVVFQELDHFAVASSTEAFVEIYKYLIGQDPEYTEIQCGDEDITLVGRAVTFADNGFPDGSLEVYELGDDARDRGTPLHTFTNDGGAEIAWQAKRGVAYEFRGLDPDGNVIGHIYFAPFKRSNRLLRFISPSSAPLASVPTDNVTKSDAHAALVVRSAQGAFRADQGDSLTVDGVEVLSEELANAESATVALFLFDDNENGVTDGGSLGSYSAFPFIRASDVFMGSAEPAFIDLNYNGQRLRIPNWPSLSEGESIVMFP